MTVTVYSQPGCTPCKNTHDYLARAGVPHTVVDITTNPDGFAKVIALGYQKTPVIVTDTDHWAGFEPDKLRELANAAPVASVTLVAA